MQIFLFINGPWNRPNLVIASSQAQNPVKLRRFVMANKFGNFASEIVLETSLYRKLRRVERERERGRNERGEGVVSGSASCAEGKG